MHSKGSFISIAETKEPLSFLSDNEFQQLKFFSHSNPASCNKYFSPDSDYRLRLRKLLPYDIQGATSFEPLNLLIVIGMINHHFILCSVLVIKYNL